MIWVQFSATLLLGVVLLVAWGRYSIETTRRRRAAELYLWIAPDIPFLIAALQTVIARPSTSAASSAPEKLSIVAPAIALDILLLAVAWFSLRSSRDISFRDTCTTAAGLLILGATVVWFAAVVWPGVESVQIARHSAEHVFASTGFLLGALLTLAGFTILNSSLEDAGDRILSRLGVLSLFFGTVCWALHLAFRLTVVISVAQNDRGVVPEWYPPMRMWTGVMYGLYMPLAYLGIAAFGAALGNIGWIGKGWGRAFVIFGLIATAGFLARIGIFDPPLVVNVMPYIAGVLLMRRNASPIIGDSVTGNPEAIR